HFVFFFFQAEDGIRDFHVTGVQTCALPISERITDLQDVRDRIIAELAGQPEPGIPMPSEPSVLLADDLAPADTAGLDPSLVVARSEERRVGRECGSRW